MWKENYEVYGADKIWLELNRQGIATARCTVERLMRDLGLQGPRALRLWSLRPLALAWYLHTAVRGENQAGPQAQGLRGE